MRRIALGLLSAGVFMLLLVACRDTADVLLLTPTPIPEPTQTPVRTLAADIPPYVFPVVVYDDSSGGRVQISTANAILVDKNEGLFAVNAHTLPVLEDTIVQIFVGNEQYLVYIQEDWIDKEVDIAIVKYPFSFADTEKFNATTEGEPIPVPEFPDPPSFAKLPTALSPVRTVGYVREVDKGFMPYIVDALLIGTNFEGYIKVLQPEYLSTDNSREGKGGQSGSAVITEDGKFVGMISKVARSPDPFAALVIPASEIEALLKKVQNSLR